MTSRFGRVCLSVGVLLSASLVMVVHTWAGEIRDSQSRRASYGLPADDATVRAIAAWPDEAASAKWGMALSPAEAADLEGRLTYEYNVEQVVAPLVRGLPSYAGMFFDQLDAGRLVVILVDDGAEAQVVAKAAVARLMPKGPAVAFRSAARPYSTLEAAIQNTFKQWQTVTGLPDPYQAAVDIPANLVRILVDEAIFPAALAAQSKIEASIGVPIRLGVGRPAEPHSCTSRDYCTNPIKQAVLIRQGSITGSPCTMAFQVSKSGDKQFLTAAHCALYGSQNWYHKGYGFLGSVQQSLFSSGFDAVRIGLPDSQATPNMYGDGYIVGWAWPTLGSIVWQNQAYSNSIDPTQVLDDYLCWTWNGQTLCGAKMQGVGGFGGDSGSPLYKSAPSPFLYAAGINFGGDGSGNGLMTRVGDVLSRLGVTLVT